MHDVQGAVGVAVDRQKPALRDEKAWQAALAKSTPGD
jgi:hypothetical protein